MACHGKIFEIHSFGQKSRGKYLLEIPKFLYNTIEGRLQAKNQLDSSIGFDSIASRGKNSVIQLINQKISTVSQPLKGHQWCNWG